MPVSNEPISNGPVSNEPRQSISQFHANEKYWLLYASHLEVVLNSQPTLSATKADAEAHTLALETMLDREEASIRY